MSQLFERLQTLASVDPERAALSDLHHTVRYGELWQQVQDLAERLAATGIRRLALRLDNGLNWARFDLAATRAGIVLIPVPTFFSALKSICTIIG